MNSRFAVVDRKIAGDGTSLGPETVSNRSPIYDACVFGINPDPRDAPGFGSFLRSASARDA